MSSPMSWSAEWYDANPVLRRGEPRFDKANGQLKIGDGATPWSLLDVVESFERPTLAQRQAETIDTVKAALLSKQIEISASGVSAVQNLLTALKRNASDVSILIIGDQTSSKNSDWPLILGNLLVPDWPTHSITYQTWDDTNFQFAAPTSLRFGSGPQTLRILNCSFASWNTGAVLGARYQNAVQAPSPNVVSPNLIMISLGHNEEVNVGVDHPGAIRGRYLALTESVAATHPTASIVTIMQSPVSNTNVQAVRADVYTQIASERGYGIIDVHQVFVDAGKPAAWYADTTQLSALGSQKWAEYVYTHFRYQPSVSPITRHASCFLSTGQNLLTNSNFALFASVVPDTWARSGATTLTKDTTAGNRETKDFGMRIGSGNAGVSELFQTLSATQLAAARGGWVTFAARVKITNTTDLNRNRIRIAVNGGQTVTSLTPTQSGAGWRWLVACVYVPYTASTVSVSLFADIGASGVADMIVDRCTLVRGSVPRDSALV